MTWLIAVCLDSLSSVYCTVCTLLKLRLQCTSVQVTGTAFRCTVPISTDDVPYSVNLYNMMMPVGVKGDKFHRSSTVGSCLQKNDGLLILSTVG